MRDVADGARGKVIQHGYPIPLLDQVIGQVRPHKTRASSNQVVHSALLLFGGCRQFLVVRDSGIHLGTPDAGDSKRPGRLVCSPSARSLQSP